MTATSTTCVALRPLVDALVATPLDDLGVEDLRAQITAVTPQVARLQGWLHTVVSRLDQVTGGTVPADEPDGRARTVSGWLADVSRSTAGAAGSQLRTARLLRSLPLVTAAVLDGLLTPAQAAVLTRLVGKIDADALVDSQPQLIAVAAEMDPVQLGMWVAHQIATHCEPAFDDQQARARDHRFLTSRREADGSLRGTFLLPAEDSEVFLTALEPLARRTTLDDDRTAGQRRADALVEVCEQVLRHGELPDAGGLRPQLSYVVPADWAAGQHTRATCPDCGPRCPDHRPLTFADTVRTALPGHGGVRAEQACATAAWSGPQTRSRIEALLCDARISRVLLTPLGQVRGFEPLRDSITPAQRRNLAARDLGCVVRGCTRPPAMCDAHHLERRSDGGATTMDTLVNRQPPRSGHSVVALPTGVRRRTQAGKALGHPARGPLRSRLTPPVRARLAAVSNLHTRRRSRRNLTPSGLNLHVIKAERYTMLLRFKVINYRSFRDESELSLVSSRWSGSHPSDGSWSNIALPVIGIYGPNASGKSTLLEALHFLVNAVRYSATRWADSEDRFPHRPFLLDDESEARPSEFEVDFIHEGVRHNYGFSASGTAVEREWLYSYPVGRKRVVFDRDGQRFAFRRGLPGENQSLARLTKKTVLFLSMAALSEHQTLAAVQRTLTREVRFAQFSEQDRSARMRMVREFLADAKDAARIQELLREADLGIVELQVENEEVPEELLRLVRGIVETLRKESGGDEEFDDAAEEERLLDEHRRVLRFGHSAASGVRHLPMHAESAGTLAWLGLVVPALEALRHGQTLLVDEIDSSLHPKLTAALVDMFTQAWHSSGAQLIFTSHDTSLLGASNHANLGRDGVWFVEKRPDGHSEIFSLADFAPRKADNVERRYLQGRYGAIPMVSGEGIADAALRQMEAAGAAGAR